MRASLFLAPPLTSIAAAAAAAATVATPALRVPSQDLPGGHQAATGGGQRARCETWARMGHRRAPLGTWNMRFTGCHAPGAFFLPSLSPSLFRPARLPSSPRSTGVAATGGAWGKFAAMPNGDPQRLSVEHAQQQACPPAAARCTPHEPMAICDVTSPQLCVSSCCAGAHSKRQRLAVALPFGES